MRQASLLFALLLTASLGAQASDSYDAATGILTLRSVLVGNATLSNVLVQPSATITGPSGAGPDQSSDTYDPATGQLSVPAVAIGGKTLFNLVVTVGAVQSIGQVVGADVFDGAELMVPTVEVKSGPVYHNVALTVSGIASMAGGLPRIAQDVFDPATGELNVAAVEFRGRVYTNVVVAVAGVVSVGGRSPSESVLQALAYSAGAGPYGGLVQGADGNFYGTTSAGGAGNSGTVIKVTPAGQMTVLYSFGGFGSGDAQQPHAGLIQGSDGDFYGTTLYGGAYNNGAVFKITLSGAESVLHSFSGDYSEPGHGVPGSTDGSSPFAALIEGRHGEFYGVTAFGGVYNAGTVFVISASGAESVLYSFSGGPSGVAGSADGVAPLGALVFGRDGNLYGTTYYGGEFNGGTAFKVSIAGVETVLHAFGNNGLHGGGMDGVAPYAGLVEDGDGIFLGTTNAGGAHNAGTVFRISESGVEAVLHSFAGGAGASPGNPDGASPTSALIRASDGNFYGTTYSGGAFDVGSVYRVTLGGAESILYSFTGLSTAGSGIGGENSADGVYPWAGLLQGSDGNFYGTTQSGGSEAGNGTIFRLSGASLSP